MSHVYQKLGDILGFVVIDGRHASDTLNRIGVTNASQPILRELARLEKRLRCLIG